MDGAENWHDFYLTTGAGAAAILGASFIVATLVSNMRDSMGAQSGIGMRGFITPTAVHLGSVLTGSSILLMPQLPSWLLVAALTVGGIAGAIYASIVWWRIRNMPIDIPDTIFYAAMPILLYLAIIAGAALVAFENPLGFVVFGITFLILLIIGIRNAWDMATFMIMRDVGSTPPKS